MLAVAERKNLKKQHKIFGKILDKAEKNGYNGHMKYLPAFICKKKRHEKYGSLKEKKVESLWRLVLYSQKEKIVYSHDFAKAFWGEGTLEDRELGRYPEWLWHLQVMVSTENPISYLEEFLNEEHS